MTLHVGLGTFRPVKVENVKEHHMHSEYYQVSTEAAEKINRTKKNGGRVICVGTTSCRTVESAADENGQVEAGCGDTDIFIYPGLPLQGAGRPDHQLPSAGIHSGHAGFRPCGTGACAGCL